MNVSFQVVGDPKGQPRPRAFAMKGAGGKYSARVFDAGTAEEWKSLVAAAAKPHALATPYAGPVALSVGFIFRRPKHHFRKNGQLKPAAPRHHTGKPDIDNLLKAVMDALTQLGMFWVDDTQVADCISWKHYSAPGGTPPGAIIEITALPAEEAAA